ncbi:hypothetical protein [Bacillus sp. FJAT-22090]|uniref:hypothetical protein n=1 Tax=Bacillus sp. FJAT-22090 TaxID=1581038 RepID=UPI00119F852B|nr:hypothetical protein [Bacillus sp. FJAT-22090]
MDNRRTEVYINGEWKEINFQELKKGDNFRMFESTGEEVLDLSGSTVFHATSDSYLNEDKVWQINKA